MAHPTSPEDAAISAAANLRHQCICQEDQPTEPCAHPVSITRQQVGRLRAYLAQHPERAIIMSDLEGIWMSALRAFLPPGANDEDRIFAWMTAPRDLPLIADLQASADLGELLDMLDAPPAAHMS
jgi:hypothetical protein